MNRDVLKINAPDQWSLQKPLGVKWYHHVPNDDVRRTTKQPHFLDIAQAQRFSLFSHTARMPDETDAKKTLTASSAVGSNSYSLTLWHPLLSYVYNYKASCARPG